MRSFSKSVQNVKPDLTLCSLQLHVQSCALGIMKVAVAVKAVVRYLGSSRQGLCRSQYILVHRARSLKSVLTFWKEKPCWPCLCARLLTSRPKPPPVSIVSKLRVSPLSPCTASPSPSDCPSGPSLSQIAVRNRLELGMHCDSRYGRAPSATTARLLLHCPRSATALEGNDSAAPSHAQRV